MPRFDVDAAVADGLTIPEIASFLSETHKFDYNKARYDGISDDEIVGFLKDREAAPANEESSSKGGFVASVKNVVGQTIKGAGRAASDFIPGVDSDNVVSKYGQEMVDANPLAVESFQDIADKPGTAIAEATGNAAPSIAGGVTLNAVGKGISELSRFAPGVAKPLVYGAGKIVEWIGPAAIAALPSYSGIRDKQILKDPESEASFRDKAIAAFGAGTVGLIEQRFGPQEWAVAALTKEGRAALAEKFASDTVLGSLVKGGIRGGGVEGAEELAQNPIEQLASYDNPLSSESLKETAFGGAMGAIGGGVLGGGFGAISRPKDDSPQADPYPIKNPSPYNQAEDTAMQGLRVPDVNIPGVTDADFSGRPAFEMPKGPLSRAASVAHGDGAAAGFEQPGPGASDTRLLSTEEVVALTDHSPEGQGEQWATMPDGKRTASRVFDEQAMEWGPWTVRRMMGESLTGMPQQQTEPTPPVYNLPPSPASLAAQGLDNRGIPVTSDKSVLAQQAEVKRGLLAPDQVATIDQDRAEELQGYRETNRDYQRLFGGFSVLPDEIERKLSLLERQMEGGEVGQRFQKDDGTWDGVKSTNPGWLKTGPLKDAGKAGVKTVIAKVRNGEALTNKQQFLWTEIQKAANSEYENDPETIRAREASRIENVEGISLAPPSRLHVGELGIGDKAVVVGKNGIPDVVEHKGYDDEGKAILKDGVTIHADPWDTVDAMGVKKGDGKAEQEFLEKSLKQAEEKSLNIERSPSFFGKSTEPSAIDADTGAFIRDQKIRVGAVGRVSEPVRRIPGETPDAYMKRRRNELALRKEFPGSSGPAMVDIKARDAALSPENDLPGPTDSQKEAGNYKKGHVRVHGLDISIENPAGSVRSGTDPDGKRWETPMRDHYGYIKGTVGKDKDHIDLFIPEGFVPADGDMVAVVDQVDPKTGKFDEHKVVVGATDEQSARETYLRNYDATGETRIGAITMMPVKEFKDWLGSGNTKNPVGKISVSLSGKNETQTDLPLTDETQRADQQPTSTKGESNGEERQGQGRKRLLEEELAATSDEDLAAMLDDVFGENEKPATQKKQPKPKADNKGWRSINTAGMSSELAFRKQYERWVADGMEGDGPPPPSHLHGETLSRFVANIHGDAMDKATNQQQQAPDQPDYIVRADQKTANVGDLVLLGSRLVEIKKIWFDQRTQTWRLSTVTSHTRSKDQQWVSSPGKTSQQWERSEFIRHTGVWPAIETGTDKQDDPTFVVHSLQTGQREEVKVKEPKERKTKTAGQISKEGGIAALEGVKSAMEGLSQLFGGKNRLGSGLAFDEETYAQAKPHFVKAWNDAKQAGYALKELIKHFHDQFGKAIRPYLERFLADVKAGNLTVEQEGSTVNQGDTEQQPTEGGQDGGTRADNEGTDRPDATGSLRQDDTAVEGAGDNALDAVSAEILQGPEETGQAADNGGEGSREGAGGNQGTDGNRVPTPRGGRGGSTKVHPSTRGARNNKRDGRQGSLTDTPAVISAKNFVITPDLQLGKGGEVAKFNDNLAAITTLKTIQREQRRATPDEQRILARYVGWGGLANAFKNPSTGEIKKGWEEKVAALEELLTPQELATARNSTQNAHYTSQDVVSAIWSGLQRLGFSGGIALEPSVGTGNFLGLVPQELAGQTKFVAAEFDHITAGIAKMLYPQEAVFHTPFEKLPLPSNEFDLIIGNPPFGQTKLNFPHLPHLNRHSIHNQFFLAGIEALKPGGVQAFVVSRFLMDAQDPTVRREIAKKANLLGAIRLPESAFKENARTEVVTDIIFLQKRPIGIDSEGNEVSLNQPGDHPWVHTVKIDDDTGQEPITINSHFAMHPEMIVGTLGRTGSMHRENDVGVSYEGNDFKGDLQKAIDRALPAGAIESTKANNGQEIFEKMAESLHLSLTGAEDGTVLINDQGELVHVHERLSPSGEYMLAKRVLSPESPWSTSLTLTHDGKWFEEVDRVNEKGEKVKRVVNGKTTNLNEKTKLYYDNDAAVPTSKRIGKAKYDRLRDAVGLLELVKEQIRLESTTTSTDKEIEENRKKLNRAYDLFVDKHGHTNSNTVSGVISDVPNGALLLALEKSYSKPISKAAAAKSVLPERPASAEKASILSRRVIFPPVEITEADSANDALAINLSESGVVDMERIASLLGKTEQEIIAELHDNTDTPLIFFDPELQRWEKADEYLGGNVVRKLNAAKEAGLDKNIAALEQIKPEPWGADKVTVLPGATWVPESVYGDFVTHLTGSPGRVRFQKLTNTFYVTADDSATAASNWRTRSVSVAEIVDAMLNSKTVRVTYYDRESRSTVFDQEATDLANMKVAEVRDEFVSWVFKDGERRRQLVDIFNQKYNVRVLKQRDGQHLKLPGKVPDTLIKMRRHQLNAIWRGIVDRFVLYDHAVGAGKTFTGIARAMERRRMGLSQKPMIVVPNHLVEQFAADVYRLYPNAKVLAAGKKDMEKKKRRRLFAKIATGDWDAVIVPHSSFAFIGIDQETETRYLEAELEIAEEAVREAEEAAIEEGFTGPRKPLSVKQAEALRDRILKRLEALRDGGNTRDRLLTFEQLGVDDLTIDEAHEFKNLFYTSRLQARGMNPRAGSAKAYDLWTKVRVLRESHGSVAFMTGTPISNSAVEMYTMMRYLAADELAEMDIEHFDAWRSQFVDATTEFEPTESGRGLKEVLRLGRDWSNMRALMDMYYTFSDSVTNEDIQKWYREDNEGKEFPIPRVKDGGRAGVNVTPTPLQKQMLDDIVAGFEGLPDIEDIDERNRTRLRLMDAARKVSIDVRAIDPTIKSDEKGGKLEVVSQRIAEIYNKWNSDKGTQLVFLDRSIPRARGDKKKLAEYDKKIEALREAERSGDEAAERRAQESLDKYDHNEMAEIRLAQESDWNAYDQIKKNLVAQGIPENEIRYIHEANTDEQKQELFDAVNSGTIRVFIGNTPRMGAGTNVQERLVALHHVDVTWKPSDIEQREGRIIRQGNKLLAKYGMDKFEVEILAYTTEYTIDAKLWSLNATKLKMINGIRQYNGEFNMEFDDEDSVSMAEIAAIASGDPLQLERVKLDAEIKKLARQKAAFDRQRWGVQDAVDNAERIIETYPGIIKANEQLSGTITKEIENESAEAEKRTITIDGKVFPYSSLKLLGQENPYNYMMIKRDQAKESGEKFSVEVNGEITRSMDKADEKVSVSLGDAPRKAGGWSADATSFDLSIDGERFFSRDGARRKIAELANAAIEGKPDDMGETKIGTVIIHGIPFELSVETEATRDRGGEPIKAVTFYFEHEVPGKDGGKPYRISAFQNGSVLRINNKVNINSLDKLFEIVAKVQEIPRNLDDYRWRLETTQKELPSLREQADVTFPKEQELADKENRLNEVERELASRVPSNNSATPSGTQEPQALYNGQPPIYSGSTGTSQPRGVNYEVQQPRSRTKGMARDGKGHSSVPPVQTTIFSAMPEGGGPGRSGQPQGYLESENVQIGTFTHDLETVSSPEDAAHILSPLAKQSQEVFLALVLDYQSRPVAVIRHTTGGPVTNQVFLGQLAGSIHNTKNAARIWFAHNHPSGTVAASSADHKLMRSLRNAISGTGVEVDGHLIMGSTGMSSSFDRDGTPQGTFATPKSGTGRGVPVTERQLSGIAPELLDDAKVAGEDDAVRVLNSVGGTSGVLLFNSHMQPIRFVPLTTEEMRNLRAGGKSGVAADMYRLLDRKNGAVFSILSTESGSDPDAASAAHDNMVAFLNQAGVQVRDIIHDGKTTGTLFDIASNAKLTGNTFFSKAQPVPAANRADIEGELLSSLGGVRSRRLLNSGKVVIVDSQEEMQGIIDGSYPGENDHEDPARFSKLPDSKIPKKTIKAYKLFRTMKSRPGELFPLFIGKSQSTPVGEWIEAEFLPTKGFANRPGWHAGILPNAPHLMKKDGTMSPDRVWAEVEIPADVDWQPVADSTSTGDIRDRVPEGGSYRFKTSKLQGGAWIIGGAIKVNRILTLEEVGEINASVAVKYSQDGAIQGAYVNGVSYLVRDGIAKGQAFPVLLHELGEHANQLGFSKDADYQSILKSLENRKDAKGATGDAIRAAMAKVPASTKPEHYWSEVAAYLIEQNANAELSIIDRIKAFFKKWLVKVGVFSSSNLSHKDLVIFARAAVNAASGGNTVQSAMLSVNPDIRYSRSTADQGPMSLDNLEQAAQDMAGAVKKGSITFVKNPKKDSTFLERLLSTPEYYFKKTSEAAGRVLQAAILRRDVRHTKQTEILGDFVKFVQDLRKKNKEAYAEANDYLIEVDQGVMNGFKIVQNGDKWAVLGRDRKKVVDADTEDAAIEEMIDAESMDMRGNGYSEAVIQAVKMARELTNRAFNVMAADMRRIIAEAKENGRPDPFIGNDKLDEAGRYGIYAAGKKTPIALFPNEEEAMEMLAKVSELVSYSVVGSKGNVKNFTSLLKARAWAAKRGGNVETTKRFANLSVKRRTDKEMRPMTVKEALAQMGDLRGSYFPRIREDGGYVLIAKKDGENPFRQSFDLPGMSDGNMLGSVVNSITPIGRKAKELKAKGYTVTISRDTKPSDDVFEATSLITSLDAILQESMASVDKNDSDEIKAAQVVDQIMTMQIADIFKARGYLASRMKRLEGDEVWEGYETDMGKALTQYGKNIAAGTAKRDTARAMVLAFTGRDYSWNDYKAEVENPSWEEYKKIVEERRIDPGKQKNLFKDVRGFIVDVLRNDEQTDRIVGTLKGLAVHKFLGFRISSAAVNATNMVTGVVGTMSGVTGEPLNQSLRRVLSAAKKYTVYRSGVGTISDEDRAVFQEITSRGWDEAQFDHEAMSELRSKMGDAWNKYEALSMFMFSAVEKANRAMTIAAALKAVKAKNPDMDREDQWNLAHDISNKAHGVYGKETLPAMARGGDMNRLLRMPLTFTKFTHNYMLNAIDIGFNKKEWKAAAYLLLSPAILAGSGATLATPVLVALASALGIGGDDPEEEWYSWAEKTFGGGAFARHGLAGMAGVNIKGSMAINVPMPSDIAKLKVTDMFGPVGGVAGDMAKGVTSIARGDVAKGIESLLPTAFGSMVKAAREYGEGVTTSNYGSVFYGAEPLKATDMDAFLRFMSFNPSRISGIREQQWNEKEVASRYQERRSDIYNSIKRLRLQGKDISPEVLKDIKRYNELAAGSGRGDIPMITKKSIATMLKRNSKPQKKELERTATMR